MLITLQAMRKIFRDKRAQARVRRRKIHNAELKNVYSQKILSERSNHGAGNRRKMQTSWRR
jgi:hypothetical protein